VTGRRRNRIQNKKQKMISHSSTEAEWAAACEVGNMTLFFQSILGDLGIPQKQGHSNV